FSNWPCNLRSKESGGCFNSAKDFSSRKTITTSLLRVSERNRKGRSKLQLRNASPQGNKNSANPASTASSAPTPPPNQGWCNRLLKRDCTGRSYGIVGEVVKQNRFTTSGKSRTYTHCSCVRWKFPYISLA